ncbi:MAG: SEC-C metal-binding domain-containing protein, partial [Bacteroidia bacterium]
LFKSMLNVVNKEVVGFLYKGNIPVQQDAEEVREARAPKRDQAKLRTSKPEYGQPESAAMPMEDTRELMPQQPIRKEVTVGRNEPCPCGSGKKFKNCHGANG